MGQLVEPSRAVRPRAHSPSARYNFDVKNNPLILAALILGASGLAVDAQAARSAAVPSSVPLRGEEQIRETLELPCDPSDGATRSINQWFWITVTLRGPDGQTCRTTVPESVYLAGSCYQSQGT